MSQGNGKANWGGLIAASVTLHRASAMSIMRNPCKRGGGMSWTGKTKNGTTSPVLLAPSNSKAVRMCYLLSCAVTEHCCWETLLLAALLLAAALPSTVLASWARRLQAAHRIPPRYSALHSRNQQCVVFVAGKADSRGLRESELSWLSLEQLVWGGKYCLWLPACHLSDSSFPLGSWTCKSSLSRSMVLPPSSLSASREGKLLVLAFTHCLRRKILAWNPSTKNAWREYVSDCIEHLVTLLLRVCMHP